MITQTFSQMVPTTTLSIIQRDNTYDISTIIPNLNSSITTTSDTVSLPSSPGIRLSTLSNEPKAVSGKIIGLSIGLPIGIFCLGLILFLLYFYFIKNSILISNPPVSPSDSIKRSGNKWFSNMFNIEKYNYNNNYNNDLEKNTKENILWPSDNAIESRIQYNIGTNQKKEGYSHILTPKYAYTHTPNYEKNDVSKYLYSNPPNIRPIGYLNLNDTAKVNIKEENEATYEKNPYYKEKTLDRKWEYNSPLSKWFLRSSLYLKENNMTTTSLNDLASRLTPTVQLKHLNILNRVNKNYSNDLTAFESERSPILDKTNQISENLATNKSHGSLVQSLLLPSPQDSNILNESRISNRRSFIYDSIGPQVLNNDRDYKEPDVTILADVPLKKKSKRNHGIKAVDYEKALPLTPHSLMRKNKKIESGKIYEVIECYSPRLTDEIAIVPGEYVRVLVTHNDGWCLVEKCTMDGTCKSLLHDIKDRKYLNDDRGIIPGECLIKK
ncbi:nuclear fusion protein Fus1p [Monosporozyma unispora]|nr:fus1 actin binding activity protein [Kazachstania unispora]